MKNTVDERDKANYELQRKRQFHRHFPSIAFDLEQRESLEEENRQVHNTNNSTITRLQELENTGSKLQVYQRDSHGLHLPLSLQSLEELWNRERQLYTEQIQGLEQSLVESKRLSIDQQTQIMHLTVQLESSEGQLHAEVRGIVANPSTRFAWVRLETFVRCGY